MGDHDTFSRSIAVPALFLAILENEVLVLVHVTGNAHRLVGRGTFQVPYRQGVVSSGPSVDIMHPTHKYLFIGRIARRSKSIIVVAAHAHDVPVSQAVMTATIRVIEVGQTQAVAELVAEGTNAIDCRAVVIAAIQLVEHREVVNQGVAIVGAECSIATHSVVGCRIQVPVAGPNGLGVACRCLRLAHSSINDNHHITVVIIIGIIGGERHAVGSSQLAGLGHHRT